MNRKHLKNLVEGGVIAAIYVVLTLLFAPISFGPIQFRVSEALTVLPLIYSSALPGLGIGVFLANLLNPESLGIVDVLLGTLATLLAAYSTILIKNYFNRHNLKLTLRRVIIAILPAIVFNALIVGLYLPFLLRDIFPTLTAGVFLWNIVTIGLSEALVVYTLGISLYYSLTKVKK